jgi:hypothetical protein
MVQPQPSTATALGLEIGRMIDGLDPSGLRFTEGRQRSGGLTGRQEPRYL